MFGQIVTIGILIIAFVSTIIGTKEKRDDVSESTVKNKKRKVGKKMFKVLFLSLLIVASINVSIRLYHYEPIVNGNAEWKSTNGQQYLEIKADDYYSLGYLTGYHLWREIINAKIATNLFMEGSTLDLINDYETYIPDEYIQEMQGIAKGASHRSGVLISYRDILIQNTFFDILYGRINGKESSGEGPLACTTIASVNQDGSVVVGQNFDLNTILGNEGFLNSFAFVYHQVQGKLGVFSLRLGGILAVPMAKNSAGVATFVNVINSNIETEAKIPEMVKFRIALEFATTIQEFHDYIFAGEPNFVLNLVFSSQTSFIAVQNNIESLRYNYSSLVVHANRFEYEDWNLAYMIDPNFSSGRLLHAKQLAFDVKHDDGSISEDELFEILTNRDQNFGEKSAILQTGKNVSTIAFMSQNYFGLGASDSNRGLIPIEIG